MKNIKESGWMFGCTYIFASETAGKFIRKSASRSVRGKASCNLPMYRNVKYSVVDIIKGKL